ncbi:MULTISPECIES: YdeI family protein [unclassified Duganella]|uniref:YdeI/OmpD-associated family protein n=1 Tax=unclassified Duganella TaxID=2636909 RepID=UPI0006F50FE6|nr:MULTISPECIES: YdeI/OmpD-associated family protein [unclassified Duganella]KQV43079.1 hypothetical protein ASD07_21845 [Duganella sp. Root336D2]KRB97206.1 hypothetical protein ASE26_04030 [Duganella sp. Root198D2]
MAEHKWHEEFEALRKIVLSTHLNEETKWGCACFTYNDQNVVLIHGFKEYCALLFFKGSLMQDPENILVQQTANVQAGRQLRFTGLAEIKKQAKIIKAYVEEAIRVEKSGAKVEFKDTSDFPMADEFLQKLDDHPALAEAFYALTPGRQRGYLLHFSSAKQAKTRESRVEKCVPQILAGKGLDD